MRPLGGWLVIVRLVAVFVLVSLVQAYRRVIADLVARGAEGVLLGCTEIDLLIGPDDAPVPVFDTTRLHAERTVDLALATS